MMDFDFYNPTKIIFGKGKIAQLKSEIDLDRRILVTYGGGSIKRTGVYDQVMSALKDHTLFEFAGIEPNPSYTTLMQAVDLIKENKIDYLLAVGGGSVIDGTKFIAAAALYKGDDPWDMVLGKADVEEVLPLATVLTLPATGSESNMGAVITRYETKDKLPFLNPKLYPTFSILDPETTFSLDERQSKNGVIDAFVHIMEQYLTYPVNSPVQDGLSEGLLQTLIDEGPKILANPSNYEARANVMWCATLALNTLIGQGVPQDWATHMIGHEVTALFNLDHAQTLAVIYPSMMQFKRQQKKDKLLQYAERVWNIIEGSEEQRIDLAIEKTREFFAKTMQVKVKLSDYGIKKEELPLIVEQLQKHGMVKLGEKGDITPTESLEILNLAF